MRDCLTLLLKDKTIITLSGFSSHHSAEFQLAVSFCAFVVIQVKLSKLYQNKEGS